MEKALGAALGALDFSLPVIAVFNFRYYLNGNARKLHLTLSFLKVVFKTCVFAKKTKTDGENSVFVNSVYFFLLFIYSLMGFTYFL